MGGPWPPNNCQNLDSDKDLFDTIYDTGTHLKYYKTSLHLQDLETNKTASQIFYGSMPSNLLRVFKKICPPNFSKLAMALILCMTYASV